MKSLINYQTIIPWSASCRCSKYSWGVRLKFSRRVSHDDVPNMTNLGYDAMAVTGWTLNVHLMLFSLVLTRLGNMSPKN